MDHLKAQRVLAWESGQTPGPYRVFIFPTYKCNLKCGYCTKALVEDPPELLNELTDERLLQLVDEGAELGVKEWVIGGGGEPMLRGELIMRMCKKIRAHHMNGVLQTNGTRFTTQQLEELVAIGWAHISVSIDGATRELNDTVRFKRSFDKILEAMEMLKSIKNRLGVDKPSVGVVCVVSAQNYNQLEDMVKLCHNIGADSLHFSELYVNHSGMDAYILSDEQLSELHQTLELIVKRAESSGVIVNAESLLESMSSESVSDRIVQKVEPQSPSTSNVKDALCFEPFTSLSIISSGAVAPCCVFWENDADNLREQSLREVWMGPYMQKMRRRMLTGTPPKACETCQPDMIRQNQRVKEKLDWLETRDSHFSLLPGKVIEKTVSSLRRNGVGNTFRSGLQWIRIQNALKRQKQQLAGKKK